MTISRRNLTMAAVVAPIATLAAGASAPALAQTERAMRRSDRALTQAQIEEAIRRTDHAVLSTADRTGEPYGVAITPIYENGYVCFHSVASAAAPSRKADNMKENPRVSVFWLAKGDTDPAAFAVNFVSVVASGKAELVTDPKERERIMLAICKRHAGARTAQEHLEKFNKGGRGIDVWRIKVEKISGKSRNPDLYFGKGADQTH